jgi:hypothetical protein
VIHVCKKDRCVFGNVAEKDLASYVEAYSFKSVGNISTDWI